MGTEQDIPTYYAGKHVFLTGATGFIGKVIIEKLLRSCPEIGGVYCLIRPKKGQDASERLQEMCESKMYEQLRDEYPDFISKVHAIHGDMLDDALGIRPDDKQFLEDNIEIVLHSAATVRFDEHLKLAMNMNVIGVRKMIQLCKNFKKLEVFVHVSTAYANCEREYIEEVIYPPPIEPQKIIDTIEWMDDDMISQIESKIIGAKPNTYTYTKQLAETLLIEEGGDLPLAIVRPSIVTASWKEPYPGWIDNLNGPSGLYVAAGKGILHSFKAHREYIADIIPVDFPANLIIATAWYTAVHKPTRNAQIYQITSGVLNPFTWGDMETQVLSFFKRYPMESCFRRPKSNVLTTNGMLHDYWILVSHLIPAYAADLGFILMGKKPRMVRVYNKLHRGMRILEYFTSRQWVWTHKNLDLMKNAMTQKDQKCFYFDPSLIHWPTYTENYCIGTKKFILKEDPENVHAARAHVKMLRNIRYCFNTLCLVLFWRLFIANSTIARNSWSLILGLVYKFVQFFRITSTIKSSS